MGILPDISYGAKNTSYVREIANIWSCSVFYAILISKNWIFKVKVKGDDLENYTTGTVMMNSIKKVIYTFL